MHTQSFKVERETNEAFAGKKSTRRQLSQNETNEETLGDPRDFVLFTHPRVSSENTHIYRSNEGDSTRWRLSVENSRGKEDLQ